VGYNEKQNKNTVINTASNKVYIRVSLPPRCSRVWHFINFFLWYQMKRYTLQWTVQKSMLLQWTCKQNKQLNKQTFRYSKRLFIQIQI